MDARKDTLKSPADLRREAHKDRKKSCYQLEYDYTAYVVKGIPTHVFNELIYKATTKPLNMPPAQ